MSHNPPNLFTLSGKHTNITYTTTSVQGQAELTYAGEHGERAFTGDEIGSAATALGTEVTVQLEAVTDLHTTTLTLLLPDQLGVEHFSTLAIVTTNPTPLTGGAGHPQRYEVVRLDGDAEAVEF